jgi:hypothetical protein
MRSDPTQTYYMGAPLTSLTREELIEAVMVLQEQFERSSDNFLNLARLNQRLLARTSER